MKINIQISSSFYYQNEIGKGWCKGYAFLNERLLQPLDIIEYIISDLDGINTRIAKLNGFFSLVIQSRECLYFAVDKVRSLPLFYSHINNVFMISDLVSNIAVGKEKINKKSIKEYLISGYVAGANTLFHNIFQLQAGELVILKLSNSFLKKERYFEFSHTFKDTKYSILKDNLDVAISNSINRLIQFANGRRIILPLSGGRDSRLIAIKLREKMYNNVLCFTYGNKASYDVRISREIAKKLSYEWHYVEYTESIMKGYIDDHKFLLDCSNYSSLIIFQDLPALNTLIKNGTIVNKDIIVPGHTGDFISGGHIPDENRLKSNNQLTVVDYIVEKHCNLQPKIVPLFLRNKIFRLLKINKLKLSISEKADLIEKWNWQERQSKLIVNSVRVYDYLGFQWWLPLWDSGVIEYWEGVPIWYRFNKNLYDYYVDNLSSRYLIDEYEHICRHHYNLLFIIIDIFKIKRLLLFCREYFRKKTLFDINNLYYFFDKNTIKKYSKHSSSFNGILARVIIDLVRNRGC